MSVVIKKDIYDMWTKSEGAVERVYIHQGEKESWVRVNFSLYMLYTKLNAHGNNRGALLDLSEGCYYLPMSSMGKSFLYWYKGRKVYRLVLVKVNDVEFTSKLQRT